MTTDSSPYDGPIRGRVNFSCYGPIRPGRSLPLYTVNHWRELAKGGLISVPLVPAPRHVVKLCSAVRRMRIERQAVNTESTIGGTDRCGSRELRDGYVVGVPVASFGAERNNHVGLDSPD